MVAGRGHHAAELTGRDKMAAELRRFFLIIIPYVWLLVFFLAPFFIVLKISLSDAAIAIPPYVPTFDFSAGRTFAGSPSKP